MFGISKIQRLDDNIKVLYKEIRKLQKQFLNLTNNYNEYARIMSTELSRKDAEYKELQKKYITVLHNSVLRDKKTGRYLKNIES
jgi:predicted RNase H-like nuclease (RuvC/YqgF family)